MPGTYGRTAWRGTYACGCLIQIVEDVIEPRLAAAGLGGIGSIFQGSYNGSVSASGGTHDEGGAIDHTKASDAETRIWRESGVASWQRGSPEDPHFDDHSHGIVIGCPHLSPAAADQVYDYKNGLDGLAGGGPDQSPSVPYITWQEAHDKYAQEADVRHEFLYLTTSDAVGTVEAGSYISWDTDNSDSAGFHPSGHAQIKAPWDCVGTWMVEGGGDAQLAFLKFDKDDVKVAEIGLSDPGGDLTIVQDLPKGYRLRVIVKEGSCPDARLKADIRAR